MPLLDAPKFYLNENLSPRLATQLRTHGIDVVTSHEAGMLAASDNDQLAFAVSEQRAIVTFNIHDFAVLHAEYIVNGQATGECSSRRKNQLGSFYSACSASRTPFLHLI